MTAWRTTSSPIRAMTWCTRILYHFPRRPGAPNALQGWWDVASPPPRAGRRTRWPVCRLTGRPEVGRQVGIPNTPVRDSSAAGCRLRWRFSSLPMPDDTVLVPLLHAIGAGRSPKIAKAASSRFEIVFERVAPARRCGRRGPGGRSSIEPVEACRAPRRPAPSPRQPDPGAALAREQLPRSPSTTCGSNGFTRTPSQPQAAAPLSSGSKAPVSRMTWNVGEPRIVLDEGPLDLVTVPFGHADVGEHDVGAIAG